MKKFNYLLMLFTAVVIGFTSCEDDPEPDNGVTLTGIPPTATIEAGGTLGPITATASALDGLASLVITKDGAPLATVPLTGTTATAPFEYTAVAADAGKNVVFEFTVTDLDGDFAKATHVLTVGAAVTTIRVAANITADATWESGKTYVLGGRITVTSGATLTIQEGVIVKGEAGTGANATALIIARGGKLNANGTATAPIIFTSVADEIAPGQIASPNLDSELSGLYGGTVADDNSGSIKYISIRHGGANIGEGNEINGLTLGGVGSGTVIENVEVIGNQDDGIEWFGGTVNVTNALIWNSGDDALDTDQAWSGTMDNFIIISGAETDHALEIDGPEGSFNAGHTLINGSVKGHPATEMADFRDGARGTFENIYFFDFPAPADNANAGRGDFSLSGDKTLATFAAGTLVFTKLEATLKEGVTLATAFRNGTDAFASSVALKANTVGADKSVFAVWSWAAVSGALDDFK